MGIRGAFVVIFVHFMVDVCVGGCRRDAKFCVSATKAGDKNRQSRYAENATYVPFCAKNNQLIVEKLNFKKILIRWRCI